VYRILFGNTIHVRVVIFAVTLNSSVFFIRRRIKFLLVTVIAYLVVVSASNHWQTVTCYEDGEQQRFGLLAFLV